MKEDIQKSNTVMLILLTIIYLSSIFLATSLVVVDKFNTEESPFIIALDKFNLSFFPHVCIGGIIIAGFSTMAASLFAVTSMLVTMSEDGDAPKIFSKKGKLKVPPYALALTISGMIISIVLSRLMPDSVYEYITTAAGLMLLYNWVFILISLPKLIKATGFDHVKRIIGMILILLAVSGTLLHESSRPGFFVSIVFLLLILTVVLIMHFGKSKKKKKEKNIFPRGIY